MRWLQTCAYVGSKVSKVPEGFQICGKKCNGSELKCIYDKWFKYTELNSYVLKINDIFAKNVVFYVRKNVYKVCIPQ